MGKICSLLHVQYNTFKLHLLCWGLIGTSGRQTGLCVFMGVQYGKKRECVLYIHTDILMVIYHWQVLPEAFIKVVMVAGCEWHSGAPVWKCNWQVHSLLFWLLGTGAKPINTFRRPAQVPGLPGLTRLPSTLRFPARSDSLTISCSHLQPVSAQNNSLTHSICPPPHPMVTSAFLCSLHHGCLFMAFFFFIITSSIWAQCLSRAMAARPNLSAGDLSQS